MISRKHFFFSILLACCFCVTETLAQDKGSNPFDIGRAPTPVNQSAYNPQPNNSNIFDIKPNATQVVEPSNTTDTNTTSPPKSTNPFDIVAPSPNAVQPKVTNNTPIVTVVPKKEKAQTSSSFLFIITISTLLLLTILVVLSRDVIRKSYLALFNETLMKSLHRERSSVNILIYTLLYSMFVINLGVFAFLCIRHYFLINDSEWLTLLACLSVIGLVILLKHSVLRFMSAIFPISKEIDLYNFIIVVFGIIMGCVLAPMNIILAYASPETEKLMTYGIIAVLTAFFGLRYLRSLMVGAKFIGSNIVHFCIYVAAFEVMPAVIMVKLLLQRIV